MNGDWPKSGLDHKDGDEKNNKINNLRLANQSENLFNTKKRSNNASGYKGVHWDKSRQKWMAFITAFKKRKHVGYYLTAEDAFTARYDAALRLHGEFARNS